MRSIRHILCIFLTLAALSLFAQLPAPTQSAVVGARRPALSPDGSMLAFVYRGDIWTVPVSGGRAFRLTDHLEYDNYPVWSPDGQYIAFNSTRTGNQNIFVVAAQGGSPKQMTYSSFGELASDWSPDGKYILYSSTRDVPDPTMFLLNVNNLKFMKIESDYKTLGYPNFSGDGEKIVYQRYGFPWYRPRYAGSAAAQVWYMDRASGVNHQVTKNDHQHLWPKFLPDNRSVVCVTYSEMTPSTAKMGEIVPKIVDNSARTPNLWQYNLDGKGRQLTHFIGGGVRWPTVSRNSGDMAFEYGDGLYVLKHGAKTPEKIAIYASSDDKLNNIARETVTGGATEAEISPDGKTIAIGVKGDIWTVPVEKPKKHNPDDAARLTDYPGLDHDFVWSKDNKQLFFLSDRENNFNLYRLNLADKDTKAIWKGTQDAFNPQVTPDGKMVAFWVSGAEGGLYTVPVEGGAAQQVVSLPGTGAWGFGGREFKFSPDMQWVAYTREAEHGTVDIYIMPVKGGKAVNVTKLNATHDQINWSPDGKYLFFHSDREGPGIYVLPFHREEARADELELKFEAPKDKTKVKFDIDFQDIELRIRKLTTQNSDGDLTIAPDGMIYFLSGGDVWSSTYDGKEVKKITTTGGINSLRIQDDGKKLMVLKGGVPNTVGLDNSHAVAPVTFVAEWSRDIRAEHHAAFTEFWRNYNRYFYDPNFHGRDWTAIRAKYEPLLDAVGVREEMANLLNMMVGELESSHSEVGPAAGMRGPVTPQLGFYFDYSYDGPGIRIKEVPNRAPGSYNKTALKAGEYVMAVNGKDVQLDENLYQILNDLDGKDLELLVNSTPSKTGAHKVTYKALSNSEWADIHYRNRIIRERDEVDKKSNGRIAYLHIAGMGAGNRVTFEREFYEYTIGKDAVIIDVRFNGGGNIADSLISQLAIHPYAYTTLRFTPPMHTPDSSWTKPVVVLMNEHSYSNAEMFPYDMSQTKLATLIGMPTPGYVIGTLEQVLVDGTRARMPGEGHFRYDGTPMENMGQQPDITVEMSAQDWNAKRDPQLEKAIEVLKQKIGG